MPDLIKYWEIPGEDLDPDAIVAAAAKLRTTATNVRDNGAATVTAWTGLAGSYTAPEDDQLFATMTPIGPTTTTFGDNLDTATGALEGYAEEIRPIKARLTAIRMLAEQFYWRVKNGVDVDKTISMGRAGVQHTTEHKEWHEDQDTVDENNTYIRQTNEAVADMWEAERRAANVIRAIYGAPPLTADKTGEGGANTYMYESIPEGTKTPWGAKVDRTESCGEATARVVFKDFLWDGIVVGGIWGTVTGLGGLISYNSQTGEWGDWGYAGEAWKNLGQLVTAVSSIGNPVAWVQTALPGPAGDWQRESWNTGLNTLKGVVAWGEWEDNPGAAAGKTVFNIGTIFIPAGAAVTGIKGGALAGKLAAAAKVTELMDGSVLLKVGGAGLKLTSKGLADLMKGLKVGDFSGLKAALPDFSGTDVSVTTKADDVGSHVDVNTHPSDVSPTDVHVKDTTPSTTHVKDTTPTETTPTETTPSTTTPTETTPTETTPTETTPTETTPAETTPATSTVDDNPASTVPLRPAEEVPATVSEPAPAAATVDAADSTASVVNHADDQLVTVGAHAEDASVTVEHGAADGGHGSTTGHGAPDHGASDHGASDHGNAGGGGGGGHEPSPANYPEDLPGLHPEGGTEHVPQIDPENPIYADVIDHHPELLLTDAQRSTIDDYLESSKANEPHISDDIRDIVEHFPDSHREGWPYRVKTTTSLYTKMVNDFMEKSGSGWSFDDVLKNMNDTVRYTYATPEESFTVTTRAEIHDLISRGYELNGLKNFFGRSGYQGINATFRAPSGQMFELQFHTPESFLAKETTHPLYNQQRALPEGSESWLALRDKQQEIFSAVDTPPGSKTITAEEFR